MLNRSRVKKAYKAWVKKEAQALDKQHREAYTKRNKEARQAVDLQRQRALQEGTDEYNLLKRKNKEVNAKNRAKKGPGGRFKYLTAEKLFTYEVFERNKEPDGIDSIWLGEEVISMLIEYYKAVRDMNPGKEVWLVMDNVRLRGKALRYKKAQLEAEGVRIAPPPPPPPQSPDLHPIERVFSALKDLLESYQKVITGRNKRSIEHAKQALKYV